MRQRQFKLITILTALAVGLILTIAITKSFKKTPPPPEEPTAKQVIEHITKSIDLSNTAAYTQCNLELVQLLFAHSEEVQARFNEVNDSLGERIDNYRDIDSLGYALQDSLYSLTWEHSYILNLLINHERK